MKQSEIQKAYDEIRPSITDGCLFLSSKNKFVSKTIRKNDRNADGSKAEFSHVGVLFVKEYKGHKRVFVIDSNAPGVEADFFSDRLKDIDNFVILKPLCKEDRIQNAMFAALNRRKGNIKYDWINGLKELFNRRYKRWFKIKPTPGRDICSDWVREQAEDQLMMVASFKDVEQAFPQDYIRYHSPTYVRVISAKDYV